MLSSVEYLHTYIGTYIPREEKRTWPGLDWTGHGSSLPYRSYIHIEYIYPCRYGMVWYGKYGMVWYVTVLSFCLTTLLLHYIQYTLLFVCLFVCFIFVYSLISLGGGIYVEEAIAIVPTYLVVSRVLYTYPSYTLYSTYSTYIPHLDPYIIF